MRHTSTQHELFFYFSASILLSHFNFRNWIYRDLWLSSLVICIHFILSVLLCVFFFYLSLERVRQQLTCWWRQRDREIERTRLEARLLVNCLFQLQLFSVLCSVICDNENFCRENAINRENIAGLRPIFCMSMKNMQQISQFDSAVDNNNHLLHWNEIMCFGVLAPIFKQRSRSFRWHCVLVPAKGISTAAITNNRTRAFVPRKFAWQWFLVRPFCNVKSNDKWNCLTSKIC